MSNPTQPTSVSELVEAVRSTPQLLAVGAGTKPRLSDVNVTKLSTTRLRGIIEYEPTEFTFSAMSGTPMQEIVNALAERGQYLPFDPLYLKAGATLGGTVAAGLNGPGRFRFGGLRDFILGVQFVDGAGRLMRMGGKVVKNAAGFDLPKFFVGSLGRFGVLTEITSKVFPKATSTLSLKISCDSMKAAARVIIESSNKRWEAEAIDILPGSKNVYLRLAGPASALEKIASEVFTHWPGETLLSDEAQAMWSNLCEFSWAHAQGPLMKAALTPDLLPSLDVTLNSFEGIRFHVSAGGNVAYISLSSSGQVKDLDTKLREHGLSAMTLRGDAPLWCGSHKRPKIVQAIKDALDPVQRFPSLDI